MPRKKADPIDLEPDFDEADGPVRLLLHAPTVAALQRARQNAISTLADDPDAEILIIASSKAVLDALQQPDPATQAFTRVCAKSLKSLEIDAPEDTSTVPAAMTEISRRVWSGWVYVRA